MLVLLLLPLFSVLTHADTECEVSRAGAQTVTFEGAVKVLTEDNAGTRVKIQIDRIVNDENRWLNNPSGFLDASLPSAKCIPGIRTGEHVLWVGSYEWIGDEINFVVRQLRNFGK